MNRSGLVLLCALVAGVLALILWEFEYQHLSFVLWLLVVVAILWCCAEVAVSLHVLPTPRRRNPRASRQSWSRRRHSMVILIGAIILAIIDIVLRVLGLETNSQLIWFLVVIALLWACAQVSLLLRPEGPSRFAQNVGNEGERTDNWVSQRTKPFFERLFPGSTMQSGFYNRGNEEVFDGNEKLPPHPSY